MVKHFDETKDALELLLYGTTPLTDDYLQGIIDRELADYERRAEFDWKYYFMKYAEFRPPRYGRYWWDNPDAPYYFVTLYEQQKRSPNSYQPFLKAVGIGELSREEWGERLDFGEYYVLCENAAYVVKNFSTDAEEDRLTINQRNGIDTEDRIKKFKAWAKGYLY